MTINQKIQALREQLKINNLDAIIIPTGDPHQSEYPADTWKDREWISGFTGSQGNVVVTQYHAGLWTDSRYFIQAEQELKGTEMVLHKLVNQFGPEHVEWIKNNLPLHSKVAFDGQIFSIHQVESYQKLLAQVPIELINVDLIKAIWQDRPSLPQGKVYLQKDKYVSQTVGDKLAKVRDEMKNLDADYYLVSALDEIAWVLNVRGNDVSFNPVVVSYLVIGKEESWWFVGKHRLTDEILAVCDREKINVWSYEDTISFLNSIDPNSKLLVEASSISYNISKAINSEIIKAESPIKIQKAIKSQAEVDHIRNAMIQDGVALAYAFRWLKESLKERTVSEYEFGEKLAECRSKITDYVGESFNPIVGYGPNGAIVHYHAEDNKCADIRNEGILLVDSGGQYHGGTTDITRTIALSQPSIQMKLHYTLVLKGHIALAQATFIQGTSGSQLDILARQFLWDNGFNYLHGTGHGIGYFLNVHEGPHGFASPTTERGRLPLKIGNIITNEPGLYLENEYGIRIENVLVVVPHKKYQNFYEFENLTYYPIDLILADEKILNAKEKAWINNYNEKCYQTISPFLDEDMKVWFRHECKLLN